MKIIDATIEPAKAKTGAVSVLRAGGLVAVPTETVYGLAADATNGEAVAKVFAAKGRPQFNPLICHVSDLKMAERYGVFSDIAIKLTQQFWPGALSLVLPLKADCGIHDLVSAGLDTIALRCPLGIARDIARQLDHPLAAPSANTSGRISPTTAQHVADDLGNKVDLVVDDGPCTVGLESTIVKITDGGVEVLRVGGVTIKEIEACLKQKVKRLKVNAAIEAPGMMQSHYAPHAAVRLNAKDAQADEALLAFGEDTNDKKPQHYLNLSEQGDLVEAAAHLYDYLKKLDASGVASIAVQPIPKGGLGEAINDRLARAAAPRSLSDE